MLTLGHLDLGPPPVTGARALAAAAPSHRDLLWCVRAPGPVVVGVCHGQGDRIALWRP